MAGVGHALEQALAYYRAPALLAMAGQRPLPADVIELLRLAAGDSAQASLSAESSGESPERVTEAAVFFVQQVMFAAEAGPHRVLGVNPDAPPARIREHYRWLIRWLHPDRNADDWDSVYTDRVTRAWQSLRRSGALAGEGEAADAEGEPTVRRAGPRSDASATTPSVLAATRLAHIPHAQPATPMLSARTARRLPVFVLGGLGLAAISLVALIWYAQQAQTRQRPVAAVPDAPATDVAFLAVTAAPSADAAIPAVPAGMAPVALDPAVSEPATREQAVLAQVPPAIVSTGDVAADISVPTPTPLPDPPESLPPPAPVSNTPAPRMAASARPPTADPAALPPPAAPTAAPSAARRAPSPSPSPAPVAAPTAPIAAAPAPTPAPGPTPATSISDTATIQQAAAHSVLARFTAAYGAGDINALMRLFTRDAVNNRGGRDAIVYDYQTLFSRTRERRLDLHPNGWVDRDGGAVVLAGYEAWIKEGRLRPGTTTRGDIRFTLRREDGELKISQVIHD